MIDKIELMSPAKLNWLLKVGPVRPDRYHEIQTVFQELSLAETMTFERLDEPECRLIGYPIDIPAASNLVTKAWEMMRRKYPQRVGGLMVRIKKELPYGGGLGGGSSNAACAIRAINTLYNLGQSEAEMQGLAAEIGSDVAFFIRGGTASASGRGEILEQLEPSPRYWLVLLVPNEGMSTAEAYRKLDEIPRPSVSQHTLFGFLTNMRSGDPAKLGAAIENDFETVAKDYPWFSWAKKKLDTAGAVRSFLCGSGSTVAGLCPDETSAQRIALSVRGILTYTR